MRRTLLTLALLALLTVPAVAYAATPSVTYSSFGYANAGGVGSLSVAVPPGVASGHLLITHIISTTTPTTLSGWTPLCHDASNLQWLYTKTAGASEGSTYAWTGGTYFDIFVADFYDGSGGSLSVDNCTTADPGSSTSATSPTNVTAQNNELVANFISQAGTATITGPATWIQNDSPGNGMIYGYFGQVTAGTAPAQTFTSGTTQTWRTSSVSIKASGPAQIVVGSNLTTGTVASTSLTGTIASGIVAGNIETACVGFMGGHPVPSPPAGWNSIGSCATSADGNAEICAWSHTYAGGDVNPQFTFASGATPFLGLTAFSNTGSSIDVSATATGTATPAVAPSITTTRAGEVVAHCFDENNTAGTLNGPLGQLLSPAASSGAYKKDAVFQNTAGATSTVSLGGTTGQWAALSLAILASSSGGGGNDAISVWRERGGY